jgi:hypothetical protein
MQIFRISIGLPTILTGFVWLFKTSCGRYFEVGRSSSESLLDLFLIHDIFPFYPTLYTHRLKVKQSSLNSKMLCQVYKLLESICDPNNVVSWTQSERHVAQESISKCLSSLLLKTYSYGAVKLPMDFRRN